MTILITGIQGFVGRNLVSSFKDCCNFYGVDILFQDIDGVKHIFDWHELAKIPPINSIIHLAGKAHDTKNTSDPQSYFDINVGLTKKIFDYYLESEATKFIFFSSVKAVADTVEEVLTEDIDPNPQTPYGQSKLEAEHYILSKKLPEGKKVYILRPCMIHGPGNKGNLNLLYSLVKKGIPWPLGAYENQRSFLSIDNLAFCIRQLIEKDVESGIYQVSDDEPLSTNGLYSQIANSLGRRPIIINTPKSLINFLAKTGDKLKLPINSERLKKLTESYVVSNERIKKVLGINKMPVVAKDGLMKTLKSFKGK
jgi:nucleoside-diphosphate-sugar epimerase